MTHDSAGTRTLVLDGALTMRTVEAVHAALRAAIEPASGAASSGVTIDCSAATEIDLTFIQLLIAVRISALRLGGTLSLAARPDGALLDTLTRGGFRAARETGSDEPPTFWFDGTAT